MPDITDKGSDIGRVRKLVAEAIRQTIVPGTKADAVTMGDIAEITTLLANALMVIARASEIDPRTIAANLRDGLRAHFQTPLEASQAILMAAIEDACVGAG
jgi:hypothetical protein